MSARWIVDTGAGFAVAVERDGRCTLATSPAPLASTERALAELRRLDAEALAATRRAAGRRLAAWRAS